MAEPKKSVCDAVSQSRVLRICKIIVDRARDHRPKSTDVQDLIESLSDVGLLHPLLVLPADERGLYELLAGHRRLRAARELGWEEVSVRIVTLEGLQAELAAIQENLARKALPPSEELRALARAKVIYEDLHPETRHGGARRRSSGQNDRLSWKSFAEHTAASTGKSARTIRRRTRVGQLGSARLLEALDDGTMSLPEAEEIVSLPADKQERAAESRMNSARQEARPLLGRDAAADALTRAMEALCSLADETLPKVARMAEVSDVAAVQSCRQQLEVLDHAVLACLKALDRQPSMPQSRRVD
jgi:ParB family chromosome partitioning protein